jgi:hypothetical protein
MPAPGTLLAKAGLFRRKFVERSAAVSLHQCGERAGEARVIVERDFVGDVIGAGVRVGAVIGLGGSTDQRAVKNVPIRTGVEASCRSFSIKGATRAKVENCSAFP